ncbi:hypothetical protein VE04_06328 [Pseudogymnoascus sp. 24MN13]|nr:hypothetical protein VE04_06328 [Pseudogymnoascus sp. 24MN13]
MSARTTLKFPHDPILVRLLIAAQQTSDSETIVHDALGFKKSYPELLTDILQTRDLLRARLPLPATNEQGILRGEFQYVAILSRSGYEFLVAFFAIRAMGGVCMPLGSGVLPEEAHYFLSKAKANCMLAGKDSLERAENICAYIQEQGNFDTLTLLPISCNAEPLRNVDIGIDDNLQLDPDGPGLLLFTSGTTGFPKGAVIPRRCFADPQDVEPGAAAISYNPAHWIGGARSLIGPVLTSKKLYIVAQKAGRARAEAVLEAFRNHRITHAIFTPALLRHMKDILIDQSGNLSDDKKNRCSSYFKGLSAIRCSAGVVEFSTKEFWTDLTGLPFENFYSVTELGGGVTRGISAIKGSIGTPLPGITIKLSEGNHGEIYVKSPKMLTHYIDDKKTTQAAFDEDGYFKTGDLGELKDGEYIFAGRANADYVLFGVFRISALVVESSLMDLPYISEACVVAVPDNDAKQLCGAVIRLERGTMPIGQITLARIRSDLQSSLAPFMLPALLRILEDKEELPRTVSGKPIKRQILMDFFGAVDGGLAENIPPRVERYNKLMTVEAQAKPWDWCGLQRATI